VKLDAFFLPGLAAPAVGVWTYARDPDATVLLRVPQLNESDLTRQIDGLLDARSRHLAEKPVLEIVQIVDRVAARFVDRGDRVRAEAVVGLRAVTGSSTAMVNTILDGMARDWRSDRLIALLEADLGDLSALDRFVGRPGVGSRVRAYGPHLTFHVFSGNVPGVSVTSLIRSLLVKSASLGKTALGEPVLAPLFATALHEEDPDIGSCVAVAYWPGGDEVLEATALERADTVIGYGGSEAIELLKRRLPPGKIFVGYGHRVSFGVIATESLSVERAAPTAEAAGLAVAAFDQQGCVSPHLFYVEEGGETSPALWASLLARALAGLEERLPRGSLSPGESSAIRQVRAEAEFAQIAGEGHELHSSEANTAWTVIYDPDPRFVPSCLNRVVRVKPIATLDDVIPQLQPLSAILQTVGIAGSGERIERLAGGLGAIGVTRIAPLNRMAWPPATWLHDGRPPIADLVRWCEME